jgi:hypothetical protein
MTDQDDTAKALEQRENTLKDSKAVEFYSQGVAAWFGTALEHDKSLLTLSVAGIGVLISMMQTAANSVLALLLYAGAIFAFMICLVSILMIFKMNKKHIIDVFNRQTSYDPFLDMWDSAASCSFFIAMLLSAALGISSAIITFNDKGNRMPNDKATSTSKPIMANDSFNGIAKLNSVNESFNQMAELSKSVQGMSQLQGLPQAKASQVPQQESQVTSRTTQPQTAQNNPGATGK